MDDRLDRLERFEKRASSDLIALHHAVQTLSNDVKSLNILQEDNCSSDRILSLEQESDTNYQSIKSSLFNNSIQQSEILSNQSKLKTDLEMIKSRFADFEEMFLPALQELQLSVAECLTERDQSHVLIPALFSQFERKIMDKIESLPKPQELDLDSIKKEILSLCRPAIDESKAAHNKTITNQSRLHILEKKVARLSEEGAS